MNDELKNIGELFKSKRQEMNLSIKEVENSTSIRSGYLQAIEEGSGEKHLSPVYILGFIRQYAIFLNLDIEQIAKDHPTAFKSADEKHEFSYGIGTLEVRGSMGGGVKWFPNLLWAGLAAGLLALAWYVAKYLGVI